MNTRVAVISIIVEDNNSIEETFKPAPLRCP